MGLRVGDKVRLNDFGLECIYGTTLGHTHLKDVVMKITRVGEQVTDDPPGFVVNVDSPDINRFLLIDLCFTLHRDQCNGIS